MAASVRVRTPDGALEVPFRSFPGNTIGDLRVYLQKRFKNCVVKLVGQRVSPFDQYDLLGPLLKRAKVKGTTVLFVVDDNGKPWDVAALETYSLMAVTERETPLVDTALLKPYIKGQAKYRFDVVAQKDLKANEFEIFIMLYGKERLQVIVSQDWTIRRIKLEIQGCLGIPTYNQRLFSKASAGDLLPDYKTVMDCGFGSKSCLDLSLATGTPRGTPRKRAPGLLLITRPADIRVKVPPRGRIVTLKCDQNDTISAVKTRLGQQVDPGRCVSLAQSLGPAGTSANGSHWAPGTAAMATAGGGYGYEYDTDDGPEDDDQYLEQYLSSMQEMREGGGMAGSGMASSLSEQEEYDGDADELGLSAQELLSALRASQEQVRILAQELQTCKERQQEKRQRSRRNSRSSIKSQ